MVEEAMVIQFIFGRKTVLKYFSGSQLLLDLWNTKLKSALLHTSKLIIIHIIYFLSPKLIL